MIQDIIEAYQQFFKDIKKEPPRTRDQLSNYLIKEKNYQMVVLGNSNVGKSSLINYLTDMDLLNYAPKKETSFMWRLRFLTNPEDNTLKYSLQKKVVDYKDRDLEKEIY
jgi:GTPase SAR1 family protein